MVLKISTFCFVSFLAVASSSTLPANDLVIDGLIIVPIDRIDVPARATGVLVEINVDAGDSAAKDQLLARLDDSQVAIEAERAATQHRISEELAKSPVELDLARKTLERTEQTARGQKIASEIAHRKSTNDIRVRAAQKSEAVANNELQRAADARKAYVDSVSLSEIDGLRLAWQRSQLETKQAAFDQEMDELAAKSEDAVSIEQKLAIEQSQLEVEHSLAAQSVAILKAKSTAHELALADLAVSRHRLSAPISGVITKIYRRPGQWLQIGEPVLELVRLDRLRAEGFVSQAIASKLRSLPQVSIDFQSDTETIATRQGEVVFVMPEVDPVNGEVQFWVEFDNPARDALPGMRATIRVTP